MVPSLNIVLDTTLEIEIHPYSYVQSRLHSSLESLRLHSTPPFSTCRKQVTFDGMMIRSVLYQHVNSWNYIALVNKITWQTRVPFYWQFIRSINKIIFINIRVHTYEYFNPDFSGIHFAQSCFLFCESLFVLLFFFILSIALSIIFQFTASDYHLGIFKHFLVFGIRRNLY